MKRLSMYVAIILLLVMASSPMSQTAKVIHLKAEDANQAKVLWTRLQLAQKEWDAFRTVVSTRYTSTIKAKDGEVGIAGVYYKDGWSGGFEYSDDFLTIVPKAEVSLTVTGSRGCWPYGASYVTSPGSITLENK